MKKISSLFSSLIMLLSVAAEYDFSAYAIDISGECGPNVTYSLENRVLKISGSGDMFDHSYNYDYERSPFYNSKEFHTLIVSEGVTSIGDNSFPYCYNTLDEGLKHITLSETIKSIGNNAFIECRNLTDITITNSVETIGEGAFYYCNNLSDVYFVGTKEEWNEISIGYDNECLTNATIHYECCESAPVEGHKIEKKNVIKAGFANDGYTGDEFCVNCNKPFSEGKIVCSVAPRLNRKTITNCGTVQRPLVFVYDRYGKQLTYKKDFVVDYSNWGSVNIGRYTVTVILMGDYSGSVTYPYYINPRPTTFLPSSKGGFKGVKNGFKLKWNKQSDQISGYQIQYATKSDFSNAASYWASNPDQTSATITGRASGKRYYVRIRTYKKINGSTFYSDWSKGKKSVVTLK